MAQTPPASKPPACVDKNPVEVTFADSATPNLIGRDTVGLQSCAVTGDVILCSFALTRHQNGIGNYVYDSKAPNWTSKLVDNFKVDHAQIRGYLRNGHCAKVAKITLDKDEWVWFTQEFEGPVDGITSARVVFNPAQVADPNRSFTLRSPVDVAQ
jgi:hypothetical protein